MNRTNPISEQQSISASNPAAPQPFDRRVLLKAGGALGLASLAFGVLPRSIQQAGAHQDASPVVAATPVVGPQADGSNLWRVQVGGMDMENQLDLQAFFPGEITINAGDQIWFAEGMPGFHTVFFPVGGEVPALIIPDPEQASPVAGAPPNVVLNPAVAFPTPSLVVDGSTPVNSGVDILWDPAVPTLLSFPTAGTYDYLCIPHQSVMKGTVIVQEAGAALPMDQAGYDALAQEQMAALVEEGVAAIAEYAEPVSEQQADGTTLWTAAAGAGEGQARVMQFLPNELEIKVGDSVKWIIQSPGEPHTVTFVGSGETPPEDIMPGAFADGSPKFAINPMTFLPQGGNSFDGTGYLNSGYMGIPEVGLPSEFTATFSAAGEYTYYCVLHGDAQGGGMAATLRVVE
jgi:plastocyanin